MRRAASALALAFAGWAGAACSEAPSLSGEQRSRVAQLVTDSPPDDLSKLDVDFDGMVRLLGYSISPRASRYPPGTRVALTLYWRCDRRPGRGHRLFTHVLAREGSMLENLDETGALRHLDGVSGPPLPPSAWEPGKVYRDELSFTIPDDPSPQVTIVAGLHTGRPGAAGSRLRIQGKGGDRENRAIVARLATGARPSAQVVKELAAPRLAEGSTIVIDGILDEAAWTRAASTGRFVDVGRGRENPALPTQGSARVTYDETYLYVGFEVSDKKVRGGFPPDAKDPHLWERDTIEIMIDPDGDGDNKDYYEIQINPQNLVFDTQYDDYNSPNGKGKGPFGHEEWSAALTSAVKVKGTLDDDSDVDEGYSVEARIPWASFTKARRSPPAPGDVWRMNFYAMKNNGGVAWSPILGMGNFHRASRFGRVRWLASPAASSTAPP
jgi:hypothetical protein